MTRQVDFAGKSGTIYRYTALEENRPQPPAGANYVIASLSGRNATIMFVGETDNLSKGEWRGPLTEAREQAKGVHVMTRLNIRSAIRQSEVVDLIAHHLPPMNDAPAPATSGEDASGTSGASSEGDGDKEG